MTNIIVGSAIGYLIGSEVSAGILLLLDKWWRSRG